MSRNSAGTRVCFVIPTYNEAADVTAMLERLTALYPEAETKFLIVDDESPDGTGALVRKFAAGAGRVHLLEGERRGLGHAYVRGISHALQELGAEVVVQMDADFSHDPADARKLLAHVAAGADVAIGSRYVPGGGVDAQWHVGRRLLSRWGNKLARWIAGIRGVRDCTAGFKAIRAAALRNAKVDEIAVQGYAFQVVLLHRLLHTGARVVEEPIYFRDRQHGQTKLGVDSIVEFFCNIWWLRLADQLTFLKFALTGLTGLLVNLGSFHFLLQAGVHPLLASPIAIELSILSNFMINNYWTFAHRVMIGRKHVRGLKFNLVSLLSLLLSYLTFVMLSLLFPVASPVLLQACGVVPAVFVNYFLNSYWTFREVAGDDGT